MPPRVWPGHDRHREQRDADDAGRQPLRGDEPRAGEPAEHHPPREAALAQRRGDPAQATTPRPPRGEHHEEDGEPAAERDRGGGVRVVDGVGELPVDAGLQRGERTAREGEGDGEPHRHARAIGVGMAVRMLGRSGRGRGIRAGILGQEPAAGLEPATTALQERCATNCAKPA